MGDSGTGGTKLFTSNLTGSSWLIGNFVGILPVALAKAQATAAKDEATAASPAPPGCCSSESTITHSNSSGAFHCRV